MAAVATPPLVNEVHGPGKRLSHTPLGVTSPVS
ncbi:hypothetical protein H4W31_007106 [Plantactinospora soyae]|uniref:Uncharacterized protein n=1 Tax=Plantactinospora soyae TaxID=1544732 RepID=A0A927MGW1_9ACTN|nr:hypothetical protein [Plantactinospora soyae]